MPNYCWTSKSVAAADLPLSRLLDNMCYPKHEAAQVRSAEVCAGQAHRGKLAWLVASASIMAMSARAARTCLPIRGP